MNIKDMNIQKQIQIEEYIGVPYIGVIPAIMNVMDMMMKYVAHKTKGE